MDKVRVDVEEMTGLISCPDYEDRVRRRLEELAKRLAYTEEAVRRLEKLKVVTRKDLDLEVTI